MGKNILKSVGIFVLTFAIFFSVFSGLFGIDTPAFAFDGVASSLIDGGDDASKSADNEKKDTEEKEMDEDWANEPQQASAGDAKSEDGQETQQSTGENEKRVVPIDTIQITMNPPEGMTADPDETIARFTNSQTMAEYTDSYIRITETDKIEAWVKRQRDEEGAKVERVTAREKTCYVAYRSGSNGGYRVDILQDIGATNFLEIVIEDQSGQVLNNLPIYLLDCGLDDENQADASNSSSDTGSGEADNED